MPSGKTVYRLPSSELLRSVPETSYQTQPGYSVAARLVRQGTFPSWTPYAQGGTPLAGKMMPGVFAPFNLPYYLLSPDRLDLASALSVALKLYLSFAFLYLFARLLGLSWSSSVFAGLVYIGSYRLYGFAEFGISGGALCVPLLLLLAELYFQGRRRLSLFLLPWACAFAYLSGHFETATFANLAAAAYFLARLRTDASRLPDEKLRDLAAFSAAMLGGACLAGFYLLAGQEYVNNSYTTVWRTLPAYGWQYHVIGKHLTEEDATVASFGLALGALGLFLFAKMRSPQVAAARRAALAAAATLALALALGFMANLGFDLSFSWLRTHFSDDQSLLFWSADLVFTFLAFWAWSESDATPLRILGWMMLAVLAVRLKTPPFTNALVHLPLFGNFNNEDYHFIFDASAALLCAAAFDRLRAGAGDAAPLRRAVAARAALAAAVLVGAAALARPAEGWVARHFATGLNPLLNAQGPSAGGIMGPERVRTTARRRTVAGWVSGYPQAPESVTVGTQADGRLTNTVRCERIECSAGRCWFSASLPMQDGPVAAVADYGGGRQRGLQGPTVQTFAVGGSPWGEAATAAVLLASPALLLLPPAGAGAAAVGMLLVWGGHFTTPASPSDAESARLPGIERVQTDAGLYRVGGFGLDFLHADFLNIRGLQDFRTGGDNLDVFSMIEFSKLCYYFLEKRGDPASVDLGLRLLGLANVRYLLARPGETLRHPSLAAFYEGPDMQVYRNLREAPRAAFYDRSAYFPLKIKDLREAAKEGQALGSIAQGLLGKQLDPERILLLHDLPSAPHPESAPTPGAPAARVDVRAYLPDRVTIDVTAPRAGFLFLADNDFPGWRATVDGRPATILRSWITFRAVEVPAGKSTVEFAYRPSWLAAIAVSVAACVVWFALLLRFGVGPDAPRSAAPAPSGKKKAPKTVIPQAAAVSPHAEETARLVRVLGLGLVAATAGFWAVWAGFVFHGPAVNWGARLLLCAAVLALGLRWRRGS